MSYVDYVEKNNTVYNFTSKSVADRFDTTTAYAVGDIVYYEDKLYRFTTAHSAGAWNASHVVEVKVADEIADLKEALTDVSATLATKADKDGTVASAEQLLSDVGTEDKQPYLFRAVPYDSTRVDEEIVGCSVGWNQLIEEGNYLATGGAVSTVDGVATFTASASGQQVYLAAQALQENHVILAAITYKTTTASADVKMRVFANDVDGVATTGWQTVYSMLKLPRSGSNSVGVVDRRESGWDAITVKEAMFIDLTAWFGSTIADYANTLETATAGSGVAWIKALLPGGYIQYSAPGLKSVSGLSGHRFVGKNLLDPALVKTQSSWNLITLNVEPNTAYVASTDIPNGGLYVYFNNDGTMGGSALTNVYEGHPISVTSTADGKVYIAQRRASGSDDFANYVIQVEKGTTPTKLEPYETHTYALDSDLTLRGILKMDSDHRVYADGDVYGADGTVTRKYGIVDLGTLTWTAEDGLFYSILPDRFPNGVNGDGICAGYPFYGNSTWGRLVQNLPDKNFAFTSDSAKKYIAVKNTSYNDASSLKASLSGEFLVYLLDTPTTETADPFTSPQNCAPGGTEEYVYAEGGSGVPVGHNSKYQKNLKGELERVSVAVPAVPGQNGTYSLKATVTSSGVTYAWTSD